MKRVALGALGHVHEFINAQVTFAGGRGANGVGLVGEADVERGAIHIAIHSHGGDAQFMARARDAHRNLAPVRYQNLTE